MKAKEVLKILKVTRPTLTKYVKDGKIKVTTLPSGFYDYNEDSVLSLTKIENAPCMPVVLHKNRKKDSEEERK